MRWVLMAAASLLVSEPTLARQLDAAACEKAKADQAQLISAGVKDDMAKGPEWVASNLPPERIARIKAYISLEEDIRFRCPLVLPKPQKHERTSTTSKETPEATNEATPVKPAPKAKPTRQRRAIVTQTRPIEPADKEKAKPPSALQDQAKDLEKKTKTQGEGDQ